MDVEEMVTRSQDTATVGRVYGEPHEKDGHHRHPRREGQRPWRVGSGPRRRALWGEGSGPTPSRWARS
jgi:hypothetical protein